MWRALRDTATLRAPSVDSFHSVVVMEVWNVRNTMRRRMTRSWIDYLLCQFAADKKLSTLESLPAEILEIIYEDLQSNSISGVRALALASRICRALASPYFFKPVNCEFKELKGSDMIRHPPVVTLSTKDNFKTLTLQPRTPSRTDRTRTISQVLSVDGTYECFEYLPDRVRFHDITSPPALSAPALDLLSRNLPLLSRMTIGFKEFMGYSTSWDRVFEKAIRRRTLFPMEVRDLFPLVSHTDGLDMICAIARFENLRHLALHYELWPEQATLMHPTPGCQAACELYESIQARKRGQSLLQLKVVFNFDSVYLFCHRGSWKFPKIIANKMTITCDEGFSMQDGRKPQCRSACDIPHFGKIIERRWRTEMLYGERAWRHRLGGIQYELLHGKYKSLPWSAVMETVMRLVLLPSHLSFKNGQRVRYEPSLTKAEMSDLIGCSTRPRPFTDILFEKMRVYRPLPSRAPRHW